MKRRKEIAQFEDPHNPYLLCVGKKIRNINKKLAKINALEQKQKETDLNSDQLSSISNKPKFEAELARWRQVFEELKGVAYDQHKAKQSAVSEDLKSAPEEAAAQVNDPTPPVQEETPKNETNQNRSAPQQSESLPQEDHSSANTAHVTEEVVTCLLKLLHVKNLWNEKNQHTIEKMLHELEHQQVQLKQRHLNSIRNLALALEGFTFQSQPQPPAKTLRGSVELAMKYVNQLELEDVMYSGLQFRQIHQIVDRITQTTVFQSSQRG